MTVEFFSAEIPCRVCKYLKLLNMFGYDVTKIRRISFIVAKLYEIICKIYIRAMKILIKKEKTKCIESRNLCMTMFT